MKNFSNFLKKEKNSQSFFQIFPTLPCYFSKEGRAGGRAGKPIMAVPAYPLNQNWVIFFLKKNTLLINFLEYIIGKLNNITCPILFIVIKIIIFIYSNSYIFK